MIQYLLLHIFAFSSRTESAVCVGGSAFGKSFRVSNHTIVILVIWTLLLLAKASFSSHGLKGPAPGHHLSRTEADFWPCYCLLRSIQNSQLLYKVSPPHTHNSLNLQPLASPTLPPALPIAETMPSPFSTGQLDLCRSNPHSWQTIDVLNSPHAIWGINTDIVL